MATERIISIAQTVYDYLKRNCVGTQTSTSEALAAAYHEDVPIQSEEDLWEIDYALSRLMSKERKYVRDLGENTDCFLGFPYNIPFYFRPRSAKSPAWKIRIPYFNSGEDYFQWMTDIPDGSIPKAYERYFRWLYQATIHKGYEHPIPKAKMIKALKRSQRTGEMIVVAPDKEFLPGGSRADQYDGWTYHLEFVSMREYFSEEYDFQKLCGGSLPPKDEWVEGMVNHPNDME